MIEITWQQLKNQDLTQALNALAGQRMEFSTTLKVLNILKSVESEQKMAFQAARILTEKFIDREKESELLKAGKLSEVPLKDGVLKEEYEKSLTEYLETKSRIRATKIKADELSQTKLTPIELLAIEPFIIIPEEKPDLKSV